MIKITLTRKDNENKDKPIEIEVSDDWYTKVNPPFQSHQNGEKFLKQYILRLYYQGAFNSKTQTNFELNFAESALNRAEFEKQWSRTYEEGSIISLVLKQIEQSENKLENRMKISVKEYESQQKQKEKRIEIQKQEDLFRQQAVQTQGKKKKTERIPEADINTPTLTQLMPSGWSVVSRKVEAAVTELDGVWGEMSRLERDLVSPSSEIKGLDFTQDAKPLRPDLKLKWVTGMEGEVSQANAKIMGFRKGFGEKQDETNEYGITATLKQEIELEVRKNIQGTRASEIVFKTVVRNLIKKYNESIQAKKESAKAKAQDHKKHLRRDAHSLMTGLINLDLNKVLKETGRAAQNAVQFSEEKFREKTADTLTHEIDDNTSQSYQSLLYYYYSSQWNNPKGMTAEALKSLAVQSGFIELFVNSFQEERVNVERNNQVAEIVRKNEALCEPMVVALGLKKNEIQSEIYSYMETLTHFNEIATQLNREVETKYQAYKQTLTEISEEENMIRQLACPQVDFLKSRLSAEEAEIYDSFQAPRLESKRDYFNQQFLKGVKHFYSKLKHANTGNWVTEFKSDAEIGRAFQELYDYHFKVQKVLRIQRELPAILALKENAESDSDRAKAAIQAYKAEEKIQDQVIEARIAAFNRIIDADESTLGREMQGFLTDRSSQDSQDRFDRCKKNCKNIQLQVTQANELCKLYKEVSGFYKDGNQLYQECLASSGEIKIQEDGIRTRIQSLSEGVRRDCEFLNQQRQGFARDRKIEDDRKSHFECKAALSRIRKDLTEIDKLQKLDYRYVQMKKLCENNNTILPPWQEFAEQKEGDHREALILEQLKLIQTLSIVVADVPFWNDQVSGIKGPKREEGSSKKLLTIPDGVDEMTEPVKTQQEAVNKLQGIAVIAGRRMEKKGLLGGRLSAKPLLRRQATQRFYTILEKLKGHENDPEVLIEVTKELKDFKDFMAEEKAKKAKSFFSSRKKIKEKTAQMHHSDKKLEH